MHYNVICTKCHLHLPCILKQSIVCYFCLIPVYCTRSRLLGASSLRAGGARALHYRPETLVVHLVSSLLTPVSSDHGAFAFALSIESQSSSSRDRLLEEHRGSAPRSKRVFLSACRWQIERHPREDDKREVNESVAGNRTPIHLYSRRRRKSLLRVRTTRQMLNRTARTEIVEGCRCGRYQLRDSWRRHRSRIRRM